MLNRKHRIFALLCLLLALSMCLTSCGGKDKKAQKAQAFAPRLDTQVSASVSVAGHYSNFEALEAEFSRFNQYYPNVRLTYTYMDGYSKSGSGILSTALSGSEAPDIFFTYPYMDGWPDGDVIANASENLADPALGLQLDCIRPELLNKDKNGQVLSVPVYTTTYGMLVNEDLFKKAGLTVPKTFAQLLSACEKLKAAGYAQPIWGYSKSEDLLYPLYYPFFCGQIKDNEAALSALNGKAAGAGEYARGAFQLVADIMGSGSIDLAACDLLKDNYDAVIMRFFEGDIPMMLCSANTVSGTEKREAKSAAFSAKPFKYSFHPVPSTDEGGYFINTISIGFAVNKNSKNLDMANEFMRFLLSTEEMNLICKAKRMVTPCVDMSLDSVYAPFQSITAERFIDLSELPLSVEVVSWVSKTCWQLTLGGMSVDEAVSSFDKQ